MRESPIDLLSDGISALEAIYCLLLQAATPRHDQLTSVKAGSLCILVRLVRERLEDALDGIEKERAA